MHNHFPLFTTFYLQCPRAMNKYINNRGKIVHLDTKCTSEVEHLGKGIGEK